MADLSVIMPFVNEWPQLIWTVRSIAEELIDEVDFEIIAVNNYCKKMVHKPEDKGGKHLRNVTRGNKWLKVIDWGNGKGQHLSHWNAKRVGIENSTGKFLFFVDAHCAVGKGALVKAFKLYESSNLNGTLHLPLTYQILEWSKLIYGLVVDEKIGKLHYTFAGYRHSESPYEVPCMSTCGMLVSRDIYEDLGGWPRELGIYGGGENFMNFAAAILGYQHWIMPGRPLYHHGDRRGYAFNYTDFIKNRMIANYLFGGKVWLRRMADHSKGHANVLNNLHDFVIESCSDQRNMLKAKQKISIEGWLEAWKTK